MHAPIAEAVRRGEMVAPYSTASGDEAPPRRRGGGSEGRARRRRADPVPRTWCCTSACPRARARRPTTTSRPRRAAASRRLPRPRGAVGVRVAVEVIPNPLSTPGALVRLIEDETDELDVGICLDYGHAHLMGDVGEAIEEVSGHLLTTHVHDNRRRADDHLPPFARHASTGTWR